MARLQDFQPVTPTDSDNLLVVQATGQGLVSYGAKLNSANPTGTGSLSLNKASGSTLGTNAVALGTDNTASGAHSFAEGNHTIASHKAQHVFGEYNLEDVKAGAGVGDRGNYIEVVGKGTSDSSRSNARTLDWSGNEVLAGDLTIKGNMSVYDNLNGTVTTQTVDGITWTVVKQGRLYEMHAVIPVSTSSPITWGSLYVYRNTNAVYGLPITLTEKLCDISYGTGAFAFWQVMYTDLGAYYKSRTTADIARPTAASGTSIDVHKYIRGYV